jgi:hypothetical protein
MERRWTVDDRLSLMRYGAGEAPDDVLARCVLDAVVEPRMLVYCRRHAADADS